MRSKIIADITVILAGFSLYIWWMVKVPLSKEAPIGAQELVAVLIAIFGIPTLIGIAVVEIIKWIHRG